MPLKNTSSTPPVPASVHSFNDGEPPPQPQTQTQPPSRLWDSLRKVPIPANKSAVNRYIETSVTGVDCPAHSAINVAVGNRGQHEVFIHANTINLNAQRFESTANVPVAIGPIAVAGQSPQSHHRYENFLAQSLISGKGLFQFVSPRANKKTLGIAAADSKEEPIITQLKQEWNYRTGKGEKLILANRFEVTAVLVKKLENSKDTDDHCCCELTAIDLSDNGKVKKILLTQAGLAFSDKVLHADEIERANDLMEFQKVEQNTFQGASDEPASSAQTDPMIVSYAGIGRNATLITYRETLSRMQAMPLEKVLDTKWLNATLFNIIRAGREDRGRHFIHSDAQLEALHIALMRKINLRVVPVLPRRSSRDRALRDAFNLDQALQNTASFSAPPDSVAAAHLMSGSSYLRDFCRDSNGGSAADLLQMRDVGRDYDIDGHTEVHGFSDPGGDVDVGGDDVGGEDDDSVGSYEDETDEGENAEHVQQADYASDTSENSEVDDAEHAIPEDHVDHVGLADDANDGSVDDDRSDADEVRDVRSAVDTGTTGNVYIAGIARHVSPLNVEVATWREESARSPSTQQTIVWSQNLQEDNAKEFSAFLETVRQTGDYTNPTSKHATIKRVNDLLDQIAINETLREDCYHVAFKATEDDTDLTALRLIDMETLCRLAQASDDVDNGKFDPAPDELIELYRGIYRLQILAKEAKNKIDSLHITDPIDVHLGYILNCVDEFNLPVNARSMQVPRLADLTEDDLIIAKRKLHSKGLLAEEKKASDIAFQRFLSTAPLVLKLLERVAPISMSTAFKDATKLMATPTAYFKNRMAELDPDAENYRLQAQNLDEKYKHMKLKALEHVVLPLLLKFLQHGETSATF